MKERKDLKHLIPWIIKACDENIFPGLLGWRDKAQKIFFVTWVHKSSENWEKSKSTVFEAWANYKKKLGEKDDRDLKAAFRNALRSKKNNLKEISKSRNDRTWKIISDSTESAILFNKITKAKQRKTNKKWSNEPTSASPVSIQSTNSSCSSNSYNSMTSSEGSLPSYQSFFNVSPPTPPKQKTDVYLETLVPQDDFFCLQEEIMKLSQPSSPNDIYRVPSPISLLNLPSTSFSFFEDFNEANKNIPQTVNSTAHFPSSSANFLSLNTFEKQNEKIVPIFKENTWDQTINFDLNQFAMQTVQQTDEMQTEIQQPTQQLLQEDLNFFFDF